MSTRMTMYLGENMYKGMMEYLAETNKDIGIDIKKAYPTNGEVPVILCRNCGNTRHFNINVDEGDQLDGSALDIIKGLCLVKVVVSRRSGGEFEFRFIGTKKTISIDALVNAFEESDCFIGEYLMCSNCGSDYIEVNINGYYDYMECDGSGDLHTIYDEPTDVIKHEDGSVETKITRDGVINFCVECYFGDTFDDIVFKHKDKLIVGMSPCFNACYECPISESFGLFDIDPREIIERKRKNARESVRKRDVQRY